MRCTSRSARPSPGTPADGVLQAGDVITAVDGKAVSTRDDVVAAITEPCTGHAGQGHASLRAGVTQTVTVRDRGEPHRTARSRGSASSLTPTSSTRRSTSTINLGQDIGGPSAGLIFSLAIYDKITPGTLTGGRDIAGTGTIDVNGNVGEIGGIQQKIAGAYDDGARDLPRSCGQLRRGRQPLSLAKRRADPGRDARPGASTP